MTSPARPPIIEYVDGLWSTPDVTLPTRLENPNTGEDLGPALASSDAVVARALEASQRAHVQGTLLALGANGRADVLDAIADRLDTDAGRIADLESLATGVVRSLTGLLSVIISGSFRLAAAQLRAGVLFDDTLPGPTGRPVEVHRLPLGPAACLVPWNAPAPMAAHKVANALAAGCPAILKPSELAPYGSVVVTQSIAAVLADHNLPAGLFQLVHGGAEVGGLLVSDPRIRAVSFTGGAAGGAAVAQACAAGIKPVQLELGGNNALVIMPDASATAVAAAATALLVSLNGQWCRALGRLMLPEERANKLLDAILDGLAEVCIGDSGDLDTEMGPIINSRHYELLTHSVERHVSSGATAHRPTPLPDAKGNFMSPTLLTNVASADAREEIFGPVATVHSYRNIDQAVEHANDTAFGLEGYVVGSDEDAALAVARRVRAGGVKVNGVTPLSLHLMAPRPAWGDSGLGVEGTLETLQFFTNQRVVGVEASLPD